MKSISRRYSLHRVLGLATLVVALAVLAEVAALPTRDVDAQGIGTVTIQKRLLLANGAEVQAPDRSGYSFTLTGPGGTEITLGPTGPEGRASLGLPPGDYFIREVPRPGTEFLRFTVDGQSAAGFRITAGQTVSVVADNRVQGTGSIAINKQIVDMNGNPIVGADASGFVFAISGPGINQSLTTPTNGVVSLTNLGPGNYTVTETPRQGFNLVGASIDGVPVANGQAFPVNNQARQLIFQNRQGGGGGNSTVAIRKEVVDANNQLIANATLSGFQFTITCPGGFTAQATSDGAGNAQITGVPAGTCQINEAARQGFTLRSIIPVGGSDIGNNGSFTVGANATFNITVRNTSTGGGGAAMPLVTGCNNVVSTFPAGTPTSMLAAAVTPAGIISGIFRQDRNAPSGFRAFNPSAPAFANDYLMTESALEAIFICVTSPGTFSPPAR